MSLSSMPQCKTFVHGVVINFYSASSVLVCLRKTKTARIHVVSSFPCPFVPPPFYSALFNITHSSLSRPPSNPHSWDVVVSVTPSAMCEGSLAQLSLNKWNQSQKQLAPGEGGGFGNIPGGSGRKYWWDAVGMWACVCVFMSICVCLCACMCGWLMVEGLISWALDCSRSSPQ